MVDWGYNAWGGKYPPFDADDAVPTRVAEALGLPLFRTDVVMEGGAVDFNGAGCVLTTESVPAEPEPQSGHCRAARSSRCCASGTGRSACCGWARASTATTPMATWTTSRVSSDPRTIVTAVEDDPRDPNHRVLKENLRRLRLLRDAAGGRSTS